MTLTPYLKLRLDNILDNSKVFLSFQRCQSNYAC